MGNFYKFNTDTCTLTSVTQKSRLVDQGRSQDLLKGGAEYRKGVCTKRAKSFG